MYECSVCQSEVKVDHINPPIKSCGCDGTIYVSLKGAANGTSSLNASATNNNLSEQSQLLVKAVLYALTVQDFVKDGKQSVFVNDQVVVDEATGKKYNFNITGAEL